MVFMGWKTAIIADMRFSGKMKTTEAEATVVFTGMFFVEKGFIPGLFSAGSLIEAHPVSSGMCTSKRLSVRPIPPISVSLHAVTLS